MLEMDALKPSMKVRKNPDWKILSSSFGGIPLSKGWGNGYIHLN